MDLIDEPCTMQACRKTNGRFPRSLVTIVTQFFNECEEEMMENSHPVCKECSDKVKRSFMGEKVLRREAYREMGTKLSTKQIKFAEMYDNERAERAETLCKVLLTAKGAVRKAIFNTPSNQELLWWYADRTDTALKHFGCVITAEERNRLMHAENGNIKGTQKYHPY